MKRAAWRVALVGVLASVGAAWAGWQPPVSSTARDDFQFASPCEAGVTVRVNAVVRRSETVLQERSGGSVVRVALTWAGSASDTRGTHYLVRGMLRQERSTGATVTLRSLDGEVLYLPETGDRAIRETWRYREDGRFWEPGAALHPADAFACVSLAGEG
ncbi:MAG TPA: hypothetical protein VHN99_04365 [Deinococcales bacterium]|nr:hypothetical protein [Deinococcales bacterium]